MVGIVGIHVGRRRCAVEEAGRDTHSQSSQGYPEIPIIVAKLYHHIGRR